MRQTTFDQVPDNGMFSLGKECKPVYTKVGNRFKDSKGTVSVLPFPPTVPVWVDEPGQSDLGYTVEFQTTLDLYYQNRLQITTNAERYKQEANHRFQQMEKRWKMIGTSPELLQTVLSLTLQLIELDAGLHHLYNDDECRYNVALITKQYGSEETGLDPISW